MSCMSLLSRAGVEVRIFYVTEFQYFILSSFSSLHSRILIKTCTKFCFKFMIVGSISGFPLSFAENDF